MCGRYQNEVKNCLRYRHMYRKKKKEVYLVVIEGGGDGVVEIDGERWWDVARKGYRKTE